MKHIFRLIRWPNLIIIALTMCLMRYGIIQPILKIYHLQLIFPVIHFCLLVLSVMMIAAAGYIINDYFDVEVDEVNRPETQVIGKYFTAKSAYISYYCINAVALCISLFLCWKTDILSFFFIFPLTIGILWFYSTTYKRQLLIGNFLVSFIIAVVPLLVPMFDIPPVYKKFHQFFLETNQNLNILFVWIGVFSLFAFLLNLTREIVKDSEDFEGDIAYGRNTMPIFFGLKITKASVVFLLTIILSIVGYFYFKYLLRVVVETLENGITVSKSNYDIVTGLYLFFLIAIPIITTIVMIIMAKKKRHYSIVSGILKFVMLMGICYSIVVYFKFL